MDNLQDITEELNRIIIDNHIDKYYPRFQKNLQAERLIKKLARSWADNDRIAIIATAEDQVKHFRILISGCKAKTAYYFIEKKDIEYIPVFEDVYELDVISKIDFSEYTKVYLISMEGVSYLISLFREKGIRYKLLYDYFNMNGLYFEDEFDFFSLDRSFVRFGTKAESRFDEITGELFIQRNNVENYEDVEYKKISIRKLMCLYLITKDFLGFFDIYDKFKNSDLVDEEERKAYLEVSRLLKRIKVGIEGQKRNDINVFWIDQVPYSDTTCMPFLSKIKDQGCCFDDANTVLTFTHDTLRAMMCAVMPEEGHIIKNIDYDNSVVLKRIKEKKYEFVAISGTWKLFSPELCSDEWHRTFSLPSELLWDTVRIIFNSCNPIFTMTHIISTHAPYMCENLDYKSVLYTDSRYLAARKACDSQLQFYSNLIGTDKSKIFMSDHGRQEEMMSAFHVYLNVISPFIRPRRVNELCSLIDFGLIVDDLLNKIDVNINKLKRDFLLVSNFDKYNEKAVDEIVRAHKPLELSMFGFKGIIDKKNIYLRYSNGVEWIAHRKDYKEQPLFINNINTETNEYEYYRKLVGDSFEMTANHRLSRYLHTIYERGLDIYKEKIRWINDQFSSFEDNSVAVRMGGPAAYNIVKMLNKDNFRKIMCFVDANPLCRCIEYGLPIFGSIQECPDSIEGILLSSGKHIVYLRNEVESKKYEVIDPYKYLDEKKLPYANGFADFAPPKEAYDVM